jgi:hypothetical protein
MRVAKWGNSLAVRIPAPLAKQLQMREGSAIDVAVAKVQRCGGLTLALRQCQLAGNGDGVDQELPPFKLDAGSVIDDLAGADVEEIDLGGAAQACEAASQIIRAEALAVHRERLEGNPELFGEDLRRRLRLGYDVSGPDYATHRQTGRAWMRTVERVFERTDILLSPVTGTVAPRATESETIETTRRLTRLTYGWSLAGLPALALPCGFSADNLPIGFQLTAPKWHEALPAASRRCVPTRDRLAPARTQSCVGDGGAQVSMTEKTETARYGARVVGSPVPPY